jgi:phosphoglycolate phosphatase-like HAD superfamily hydrolase
LIKLTKEYKTIIFDCDGVVLNSNKIKTNAFYEVTKHFGHKFSQSLVDYHLINGGISRYQKFEYFITKILQKPYDKILNEELLEDFAKYVKRSLINCEIAEGLDQLKAKNPKANWLIVSGSDQNELQEVFKALNIQRYFEGGIFGSPDDKNTIIEREMECKNIKKPALFFGDSKYDYLAAKKANLDFAFLSGWSDVKNYQPWCDENKILCVKNFLDFLYQESKI